MLLLLACTPTSETGADSKVADTSAVTDTSTTDSGDSGDTDSTDSGTVAELVGTTPAVAIPAPEFVATNRDGTPRSRDDLDGHPTIMWFYPAATTSG